MADEGPEETGEEMVDEETGEEIDPSGTIADAEALANAGLDPAPEYAENVEDALQPGPATSGALACQTAFLMYQNEEGHWFADGNAFSRPIIVSRQCTVNDFRHAAADLRDDLLASDSAQRAVGLQVQMAQQAQQAMQMAQAGQMAGVKGGAVLDLSQLRGRGGPAQVPPNRQTRRHPG